jgi:hypothetical protein
MLAGSYKCFLALDNYISISPTHTQTNYYNPNIKAQKTILVTKKVWDDIIIAK